jgi:hypothetical protein
MIIKIIILINNSKNNYKSGVRLQATRKNKILAQFIIFKKIIIIKNNNNNKKIKPFFQSNIFFSRVFQIKWFFSLFYFQFFVKFK